MCDVLTTVGGVWVLGNDPVYMPAGTPLPVPVQLDLKGSEIDSSQFDRLRGHRDAALPKVKVNLPELRFERDEICVESVWRLYYRDRIRAWQLLQNRCELALD
jgi:hypothetical protein